MTLREIFNSILDYPIELKFELHPAWMIVSIVLWMGIIGYIYWRSDP